MDYDGTADTQPPQVESVIIALYSVGPMALCAIALALTSFYRLDKHIDKINTDLAAGVHADTSDLKL